MDIVYLMPWLLNMHYIVYIYSLYMLIYSQNIFQLKEWFSYHKFRYFRPGARSIGYKPFLQLKNVLWIYEHIKWINVNYIVHIQ